MRGLYEFPNSKMPDKTDSCEWFKVQALAFRGDGDDEELTKIVMKTQQACLHLPVIRVATKEALVDGTTVKPGQFVICDIVCCISQSP